MSFSYNIYIGTSLNPYTQEWGIPSKIRNEVTYDVIPHIPKKYYEYLCYSGNDLYYFFEDLMLNDDLNSGVILFTEDLIRKIPKFNDYYQKTATHFNEFSEEFKITCKEKYYHLFMLLQYLKSHYHKKSFIYYEF